MKNQHPDPFKPGDIIYYNTYSRGSYYYLALEYINHKMFDGGRALKLWDFSSRQTITLGLTSQSLSRMKVHGSDGEGGEGGAAQ